MRQIEGLRCYHDLQANAVGFLFEVEGESYGDQAPLDLDRPDRWLQMILKMFVQQMKEAQASV